MSGQTPQNTEISLFSFSSLGLQKKDTISFHDLFSIQTLPSGQWQWLHVDTQKHNTFMLATIAEQCQLHPIIIEDIVSSTQTSKIVEYDGYFFLALQTFTYDKESIRDKFLYIVIAPALIITFTQGDLPAHTSFISQLQHETSHIKQLGIGFVAYLLIDFLIDQYFPLITSLDQRANNINESLEDNETLPEHRFLLSHLRKDIATIRKAVVPFSDMMYRLNKESFFNHNKHMRGYFSDLTSHMNHIINQLNYENETAANLMQLYHSVVNARMNNIMRVLTVVSTIFIPLNFIVGMYGMNFDHIPGLHWRYGYLFTCALMTSISTGILWIMKRKKWL